MSPQYVGIADAVKLFFSNYVNFNGRSTRSEYWWVVLAMAAYGFVLGLLMGITGSTIFNVIYGISMLAILVPSISLGIRRLHDVGKSGAMFLLGFVPIANLYLLYLYCQPSEGSNQWGDPA